MTYKIVRNGEFKGLREMTARRIRFLGYTTRQEVIEGINSGEFSYRKTEGIGKAIFYEVCNFASISISNNYAIIKPREEVVKFIKGLMADENSKGGLGDCCHFGYIELRSLLDFMYDGEPESKEEELNK